MVDPKDILAGKVLIVDDQAANLLLLERTLAGAGYSDVTATNDPRAVCDLHAAHHYDLVLLDLQMPLMDGFEVMEGLKLLEKDGYLPVLVVTAQPDHKLRALQAGAKDFVTKPFDLAEVLMRVHNMLEVRLYAKALAATVQQLQASREEVRLKSAEVKRLFDQCLVERKVSERLALQVPADSIAQRLKARPAVTADSYAEATVLIADVVGLAALTPATKPARLVLLLEEVFSLFDELAESRGLRKIKTLGNSYMAAAGVPVKAPDHAARTATLALDLLEGMERFNERNAVSLQVRIGLSSGPVVAGLLGRHAFVYDLWGAAVNVASRMESHGVPGRAQLSESTRLLLGEAFPLEVRGAPAEGAEGSVKTWLLAARGSA